SRPAAGFVVPARATPVGRGRVSRTLAHVALPWGAPLTVDDVWALPGDGHRYELVDGVLLVTPAPSRAHQRAVARLVVALSAAAGDAFEVLPAPFDWLVSSSTLFQPDLIVARRGDVGEKRLEQAPLLAVEVQSPSTSSIDRGTKRIKYEQYGVVAYWLVDPLEPGLVVLHLVDGAYREVARVVGGEAYVADFPFPVTVAPDALVS
ncbi:MAG: Uma2 family endonuclease, partial [Acidimicrobiales bacterium]